MADTSGSARELVFCHSCGDEWYRNEHGLECPECHSDIVEIIEPDSDPRQQSLTPDSDHDDNEPLHALFNHRPWPPENTGAPDPDEDDIDHVEWRGPAGIHISHTTYRSGNNPAMNTRGQPGPDPFVNLFTTFLGPMTGAVRDGPGPPNQNQNQNQPRNQNNGPGIHQHGETRTHTWTARTGGTGTVSVGGATRTFPIEDVAGILGQLFQEVQGHRPPGGGGNGQNPMPPGLGLLTSLLNPANARAGDAVFTQEALDRVVTQLMEQHAASSAPGPASEAAINALPKIKISKEQLDSNGKAECSICMDTVEIGGEVTELPCKHWFHGECVGAWLKEHDTCPQCRRGITPRDGDRDTPRATGQPPRFFSMSSSDYRRGSSSGRDSRNTAENPSGSSVTSGNGTRNNPYSISESPPRGEQPRSGSGSSGSSGRGGIVGWMERRLGGGNRGGGNDNNNSNRQS